MKLFHKGLVMIASLLTIELSLLGGLVFLEHTATSESQVAQCSRNIMFECFAMDALFYELAMVAAKCMITRDSRARKRFDELHRTMPERLANLKEIAKNDSASSSIVRSLASKMDKVFDLLDEANDLLNRNIHSPAEQYKLRDLLFESDAAVHETKMDVMRLLALHKMDRVAALEKSASSSRAFLRSALFTGIVVNVLAALLFIYMFSKNITKRLGIVAQNTFRFAQSKPLPPVMSGRDEISELDQVFHDMAAALNRAMQRERGLVDNMPVGFISLSDDGVINNANPRVEALTGFHKHDLQGRFVTELFKGCGPDYWTKLRHQAMGRLAEFDVLRKDGTTFPAEVSLSEVTTDDTSSIVCNIIDITERHELEKIKRGFVSIVSHDLRTPLTSIQAGMQLLSSGTYGPLNEKATEVVTVSRRQTDRLIALVNDLLDIARLETGRLSIDVMETTVGEIWEHTKPAVKHVCTEKSIGIRLENQIDKTIVVDPDRIVQVLVNLISNAVKFSPRDSEIVVSAQFVGAEALFAVQDQGRGVPPELQDKIFERFEQVDSKDKKVGTGLGLSICKLIVDAHNGSIGVTSKPGEGSSFWFKLPQPENRLNLNEIQSAETVPSS